MSKGERLERFIVNSRYKNVSQFSKASGVPYTTIKSFIERDLERASIDAVMKMAKILNITVEELIGEEVERKEVITNEYTYLPTTISAGLPLNVEAITQSEKISIADTIMGKYANHDDVFVTRIAGDSMDKVIQDGSLIVVKPINLENLNNGDMVVFSNDHDYSVKYFYRTNSKLIFKPCSTNDLHHEQHYSIDDDIIIHGKVVVYVVELD